MTLLANGIGSALIVFGCLAFVGLVVGRFEREERRRIER